MITQTQITKAAKIYGNLLGFNKPVALSIAEEMLHQFMNIYEASFEEAVDSSQDVGALTDLYENIRISLSDERQDERNEGF